MGITPGWHGKLPSTFRNLEEAGTGDGCYQWRMVDYDTASGSSRFSWRAPLAGPVFLVGDFNRWSTGTVPMRHQDGRWWAQVVLPPGRYRYGFASADAIFRDPEAPIEDLRHGWPWSMVEIPPPEPQVSANISQSTESGAGGDRAIFSL
jgi:hypothetical protein